MTGPVLPENFWEQFDERFNRIYDKIEAVQNDIASVKSQGCAHRPGDNRRLIAIETWKDSMTGKLIVGLLAIIASLATALYGAFKP
jgi:hypothetical protein